MNARDPLPYPHKRIAGDHGYPFACQVPESDSTFFAYDPESCPGCKAALLAAAVKRPHAGYNTELGEMTFVEAVRYDLDDSDPMGVLFERALAKLGPSVPMRETP